MKRPAALSDPQIARSLADLRELLADLGREHGIEPPAGTKLADVLEFLQEIDVPPGAFFREAFRPLRRPSGSELARRLEGWASLFEILAKTLHEFLKIFETLAAKDSAESEEDLPPILEPLAQEDGRREALRAVEAVDEAARKLLTATGAMACWIRGGPNGQD